MNHVVIKEHGYIFAPGGTPQCDLDSDNCQIVSEADFTYLKSISLSGDLEDAESLIKLTSLRRKEALKFTNYAGILQTPSGTVIEVLPKIYNPNGKEEPAEAARATFLEMLSCFRELPYKKGNSAHLDVGKIPLLEFFIRYFLDLITQLIRYGIRSDYVGMQDNMTFIKGKLVLHKHIHLNAAHRERFYVHFDEFMTDRPENRLIKSSLLKVARLAQSTKSQKLCREHLLTFYDIPHSNNYAVDFQRCHADRNIAHYAEVMRWCRILLNDNPPRPQSGPIECISLLFPMERVFEDYVAAQLRKNGWEVKTQLNSRHLVQNHKNRKFFVLKPDLELVREGRRIIADTKWKLVNQNRNRYGISREDLYQIFAYGHKYFRSDTSKDVFLIYPKTDNFSAPLESFEFEKEFTLRVLPFDIQGKALIGV